MHAVYIARLSNDELYVGYSADLKRRLKEHERGTTSTTNRLPMKTLEFVAYFRSKKKALDFEKYLNLHPVEPSVTNA